MENFNITVNSQDFTVEPQENGTYRIMNGEEKTGVIYAEPSDEGTQWRTLDGLEDSFVAEVGKLITRHNQ
ncbi:hypothetical protein [Pedobacter roseus]|uniref:Uncharacterized protein n=1 Tax=Pedobacter roseus TaxID=336820 RepID=A0A7G9QK39_9SPHI|nr:hypothetical protein [Pedobacter roseus]QNN43714.1 hypothetical protein H9L23_06375 [Pedobacter roseus]